MAKAYADCVELEERSQKEASLLGEDLSALRADLHALLMQTLREANISFIDRAHAAQIAFDLIKTK